MAVTETRLLVLGAVALFEPANGYLIRRELMSWEGDQWAPINPVEGHLARRADALAVHLEVPTGTATGGCCPSDT